MGYALLVGNTSYNPREENLPPALKCVRDLECAAAALWLRGRGPSRRVDRPGAGGGGEDPARGRGAARPAGGVLFRRPRLPVERRELPRAGRRRPRGRGRRSCRRPASRWRRRSSSASSGRSARSATVIMVDACRTPDRPRTPGEGYNQTLPPEGCHVAFATGPGKRAFAPNDPEKNTLFAEVLVEELDASPADRSVLLTLESVRAKVANRVNSIPTIVRVFGRTRRSRSSLPTSRAIRPGRRRPPPARSRRRRRPVRRRRRAPSSTRRARSARPRTRRRGCAPTWRSRRRATRPRSPSCACATWRRCCARRGPPASTSMSPSSRQASGRGSPKTSAVRSRATSTRRCASPKRCRGPRPAAS